MQQKYYKQKQIVNAEFLKQFDETVEHIISACPIKAKERQIKRHDRNCDTHWYDLIPKSVETSHEGNVTILWNQQVRTDRTIPNNKPDVIIHDNKKEHAY
jgi:hypothetical protein